MYLIFYIPISIILVLFSIFSHYESDAIELFLIENSRISWEFVPTLIRAFNGFVWSLSIIIIIPSRFQKLGLKLAAAIMGLLLIYLSYHIVRFGEESQCNCWSLYFDVPKKTVLTGVTLFFLFCLIVLYKVKNIVFAKLLDLHLQSAIILVGIITTFSISFLLNPLSIGIKFNTDKIPLELNLLYENPDNQPKIDLAKGKHVITFMSFTCPYCKIAAKKLRVLQKINPDYPLYMVLAGKRENEQYFFANTGSANVKHFKYCEPNTLWTLARNNIPAIYFVNNGITVQRIHYRSLNKNMVDEWLAN